MFFPFFLLSTVFYVQYEGWKVFFSLVVVWITVHNRFVKYLRASLLSMNRKTTEKLSCTTLFRHLPFTIFSYFMFFICEDEGLTINCQGSRWHLIYAKKFCHFKTKFIVHHLNISSDINDELCVMTKSMKHNNKNITNNKFWRFNLKNKITDDFWSFSIAIKVHQN